MGACHMVPLVTDVSSLPAGAEARRALCFDQAVVFIEDAIQVGGACSECLGLGLSLDLVGTGWWVPCSSLHSSLSWGQGRGCWTAWST